MKKCKITLIDLGYEWYDIKYDGERDYIANDGKEIYVDINEESFNLCQSIGLVLLDTFGNEIEYFEDIF